MIRINPLRNRILDRYKQFCKNITTLNKIKKLKKLKTFREFYAQTKSYT